MTYRAIGIGLAVVGAAAAAYAIPPTTEVAIAVFVVGLVALVAGIVLAIRRPAST